MNLLAVSDVFDPLPVGIPRLLIAMASRRIITNEKTILDKDDRDEITPAASEDTSVTPAVPT